jgi:hypothetical protein
LEIYLIL